MDDIPFKEKFKKSFWYIVIGIILLYILPKMVKFSIDFSIDYLWFNSLGFLERFLKVITSRVIIFLIASILFFIIALLNHIIIQKYLSKKGHILYITKRVNREIFISFILLLLVFAIIFGSVASNFWEEFLKYSNFQKFNIIDPIFHKDASFYIFQLPVINFVKMWIRWALIFIFIWGLAFYLFTKVISITPQKIIIPKAVRVHLGIILFLITLTYTVGYFFKRYELLWNQHSIVKGASYTDVYAHILAYNILIVASLYIALYFLIWIHSQNYKGLYTSLIGFFIILLIFQYIYPFFLQKFVVAPNEIDKEKRFIQYTIKYTRLAYKIDKINEKKFNIENSLSEKEIEKERDIIDNIRLWDWRPLKMTFKQLQEIRPYYIFSDVDVDRYMINGKLTEVMLSAREITHSNLPKEARNWINRYLKYTHGYGIVMIPVSVINQEGLPEFYIKDIPPVSIQGLKITRPEIYYGETSSDYVIVNTKTSEFDYPSGDGNIYTTYKGDGGVQLSSNWRKFLFSAYLGSIKILFSDFIIDSSRAMIRRNIIERVKKIAPFLLYDNDPYIVLSKGKIYWIIDAYTFTDKFPYAEKFNDEINYIRNSIKVIINAYTGKVKLYIVDKNDAIAQTYRKIFPQLFSDFSKLDNDIKSHFRYPDDIFAIQSSMYSAYHMTQSDVFYNKEDLWNFPTEIYEQDEIIMDSYYVINKINNNEKSEFLNVIPFTPAKKNNMIAWLAASCDGTNYGKLTVLKFPKKNLTYGPMQIEAQIDQHSEISKLISLWGQKGSKVIRGNLLVIPIKNSLLYIEPLFLQAEKQELPEIKRVIVSYNNNISIASSLDEALTSVLEGNVSNRLPDIGIDEETIRNMADQALIYYQESSKAIKNGDWTKYGNSMNKLKNILEQIKKSLNK